MIFRDLSKKLQTEWSKCPVMLTDDINLLKTSRPINLWNKLNYKSFIVIFSDMKENIYLIIQVVGIWLAREKLKLVKKLLTRIL